MVKWLFKRKRIITLKIWVLGILLVTIEVFTDVELESFTGVMEVDFIWVTDGFTWESDVGFTWLRVDDWEAVFVLLETIPDGDVIVCGMVFFGTDVDGIVDGMPKKVVNMKRQLPTSYFYTISMFYQSSEKNTHACIM